jgi:hypothetical protein
MSASSFTETFKIAVETLLKKKIFAELLQYNIYDPLNEQFRICVYLNGNTCLV